MSESPAGMEICLRPDPRSHIIDRSTSACAPQSRLSEAAARPDEPGCCLSRKPGSASLSLRRGGDSTPASRRTKQAGSPELRSSLRSPPPAHRGIAYRAEEQRPVQRVQMRQQGSNLGQERVAQNRGQPPPRGGCGHRAPVGALPRREPWPAAPASPAWESPCRFRFLRCRCAAPASAPPVGAGSGGAPGAVRAPARPPAIPPRRYSARAGWSPVAEPESAGSSKSRGLWHLLQRELLVLYCISLQYSHRTTSRVSTLTKDVAIWMCGAPELASRAVPCCTAIGATVNEVNHNCQVET